MAAGTISGNPTTPGTYSVTVTATDAVGATASATFTWTITAATPPALVLANPGAQTSTVGDVTSLQLGASGGLPPYTWVVTGLPPGVSVGRTSGRVTGSPTTAGSYTVAATVTDSAGVTASRSFAWTVNAATGGTNTPPPGSITPDITTDLPAMAGVNTHWNFPGNYQS